MSAKAPGGGTVGECYALAARQYGRPPPVEPELPPAGRHLWMVFSDLHSTRQVGMDVNPITFTEIGFYSELTGMDLDPWEVIAVRAIDDAFINHVRERRAANE
jgi:hypothetical protein